MVRMLVGALMGPHGPLRRTQDSSSRDERQETRDKEAGTAQMEKLLWWLPLRRGGGGCLADCTRDARCKMQCTVCGHCCVLAVGAQCTVPFGALILVHTTADASKRRLVRSSSTTTTTAHITLAMRANKMTTCPPSQHIIMSWYGVAAAWRQQTVAGVGALALGQSANSVCHASLALCPTAYTHRQPSTSKHNHDDSMTRHVSIPAICSRDRLPVPSGHSSALSPQNFQHSRLKPCVSPPGLARVARRQHPPGRPACQQTLARARTRYGYRTSFNPNPKALPTISVTASDMLPRSDSPLRDTTWP